MRLENMDTSLEHAQDALIAVAARQYLEELGARTVGELEREPLMELPLKLRKRLAKGARKDSRRAFRKKYGRGLVAAILVAVTVVVATYAKVDAFRIQVNNFFFSVYEGITEFVSQRAEVIPASNGICYPEDIPAGFNLVESDSTENRTYIKFVRNKEWITFEQVILTNAGLNAAGVGSAEPNIQISGYPGLVTTSAIKETKVIWYTDSIMFTITSTLEDKEVIKIANSVLINKSY